MIILKKGIFWGFDTQSNSYLIMNQLKETIILENEPTNIKFDITKRRIKI